MLLIFAIGSMLACQPSAPVVKVLDSDAPSRALAAPASQRSFVHSRTLPKLADGLTDEQTHGCQTDIDCALTQDLDGSCCGSGPCSAPQAFNVDFVAKFAAQRDVQCLDVVCKREATCSGPTFRDSAGCEANRCVVLRQR